MTLVRMPTKPDRVKPKPPMKPKPPKRPKPGY
jgi:hypothetical protein